MKKGNDVTYYYGYEITRKDNYVDAYQHYDYIVDFDGKKETFPSLAKAKQTIKNRLYGKKL